MSEAWAHSGGMWLTGRHDGPPLDVAGDPAGTIEAALTALPPTADPPDTRPPDTRPLDARLLDARLLDARLLGERAALAGLSRRGTVTAGGAGRILAAADGHLAVSLPRGTDVDLLPALLEHPVDDPWTDLTRWARDTRCTDAVERATLLGLPLATVPDSPQPPRRPGVVLTRGGGTRLPNPRPRVLDLSSLWAGPLCAHLLGLCGAEVVKVESTHRPDAARSGDPRLFDLLHTGHRMVALDLATDTAILRRLLSRADLVIESSRPRALRQLGIHADDYVATGTHWLAITAYGRAPDDEHRVGFGDDVAAGAGLVGRDATGPVFAADALADPLTGAVAAAAAHTALTEPHAVLLDVSMHDIARAAANRPHTPAREPAHRPSTRTPPGPAAPRGAHTRAVLESWLTGQSETKGTPCAD